MFPLSVTERTNYTMPPKADRLAPKVLQAVEDGRSYRWIARDLGISKNTVLAIVKRNRGKSLT
ncbi:MAG: helix-turn-helix domain-containing protein [Rhodobacteraceae bacterium]|nr:helix-turn-helix domain-containing protein [Paracoccaceae bacterium]